MELVSNFLKWMITLVICQVSLSVTNKHKKCYLFTVLTNEENVSQKLVM